MKPRYLLVVLTLFQCIPFLLHAQGDQSERTVKFAYDDNGNRFRCWIEFSKLSTTDSNDTIYKGTVVKSLIGRINDVQGKDVSFFPNPTQGLIDLKITGMQDGEIAEYTFLSITGVELLHGRTVLPETKIDISRFLPGTYYARVVIGKSVQGWKLVKL